MAQKIDGVALAFRFVSGGRLHYASNEVWLLPSPLLPLVWRNSNSFALFWWQLLVNQRHRGLDAAMAHRNWPHWHVAVIIAHN